MNDLLLLDEALDLLSESNDISSLDPDFIKKDKIKLSTLTMKSRQRNDEGKSLVLSWYNDKEFVATILVDTIPAIDGYKWFGSFRVSKKYRGCGLGNQIIDLITSSKYKAGSLSVYTDNEVAINLYKKHGFKIDYKTKGSGGDEFYIMRLSKNKLKSTNESADSYDSSSSFFNDINIKKLLKYNMVIIGEIHNRNMIGIYDKLLTELKPDYFICEFADTDRCFTREELKDRMDNATDGATSGTGADYQYNYWCYRLAYEHNVPLIGCNKVSRHYKRMNDEDKERENYMLKVLKEFENKGTCLVQLGDHHLRSIPISKEFAEYCGDIEDDRGIVDDITVDFISPVWKYYSKKSSAIILRVKDEYKNEINFSKKK